VDVDAEVVGDRGGEAKLRARDEGEDDEDQRDPKREAHG
jgi:hypothetical protein